MVGVAAGGIIIIMAAAHMLVLRKTRTKPKMKRNAAIKAKKVVIQVVAGELVIAGSM